METRLQKIDSGARSRIQDLIRKELLKLAALCDKAPGAALFELWVEMLHDDPRSRNLSEAGFHLAFAKLKSSFVPTAACQFPTPAHFFQLLATTEQATRVVLAEQAWEFSMAWVRRYYRPDCRDMERPELPRLHSMCLNAAGASAYVSDCTLEELAWAKKRFIEAYSNFCELQHDEEFISNDEAKKIVEGLRVQFHQLAKAKTV
jgi:hypothetical protein